MFIGHFAVAFAAKKAAPQTSLGTLFIAVQWADVLWPVLLLLGIEHARIEPGITVVTPLNLYDYPISHSLLGLLLWSVGFGGLYFFLRKYKLGAIVTGLCVFSHWILDFITHKPDMPLGFGSETKVGLGLWNSLAGTVMIESAMFIAGVALYVRSTVAKDRIGAYSMWALVAFLAATYAANILGPPPPSIDVVAIAGNAGWLLVLWAYWIDRHRQPRPSEGSRIKTSEV